jgi:asparagine synthase (glutamine-hydrolysing)
VRTREVAATCWSLGLLANDANALLIHPLLAPRFLAAIAHVGGRRGLGVRTALMRALFAELLPEEVIARSSKARFDGAFWRADSRGFAEAWSGEGVDHDLVDPALLREEWLSPSPDARSVMLLQSAWLGLQQPGGA